MKQGESEEIVKRKRAGVHKFRKIFTKKFGKKAEWVLTRAESNYIIIEHKAITMPFFRDRLGVLL